jgi:hypothetical protein
MRKKKNPHKEVFVYLEFDRNLQELTGKESEKIFLSEGTPVLMLIQAVFESYPGITSKYSLSTLSFSINGSLPSMDSTLRADDIISLHVTSPDLDYYDFPYNQYRQ